MGNWKKVVNETKKHHAGICYTVQMSDTHSNTIDLAPELEARLAPLAARSGQSVKEFAQPVLLHHAHEQEQRLAEYAEDDARWERYLATGESIPAEVVLAELDDMTGKCEKPMISVTQCCYKSL